MIMQPKSEVVGSDRPANKNKRGGRKAFPASYIYNMEVVSITYHTEIHYQDNFIIENITPDLSKDITTLLREDIQQTLYDVFKKYVDGQDYTLYNAHVSSSALS